MGAKIKKVVLIVVIAVSVALILWITMYSRIGSDIRKFYPPFWTYKEILNGNMTPMIEMVENIILFIPIGVMAVLVLHLNVWQAILMGLICSLCIEVCQWTWRLGAFEIDDLLHNTLGAAIGAALSEIPIIKNNFRLPRKDRLKNVLAIAVVAALSIGLIVGYYRLEERKMIEYASMNDKEDGTKNLLVLNSKPNYIGETNFTATYNSDGTVLFEGYTENKAWIEIGRLTLDKGTYYFAGLSGVPAETVALELEYFDEEKNNFFLFTKDVGPVESDEFVLEEPTEIRCLIRLYPGAEGSYVARPVIYEVK